MPELPEVETVVRDLRPLLTRRVLRAVRRASAADLRRAWDSSWEPLLAGRRVSALDRRGKWIIVRLDDGSALLVHLGMTGQFTVSPRDEALPTHTHLVFDLDSPTHLLRFRDTRRFGCVVRVPDDAAVVKHFADNGMGPEPFGLDAGAWAASLAEACAEWFAGLLGLTNGVPSHDTIRRVLSAVRLAACGVLFRLDERLLPCRRVAADIHKRQDPARLRAEGQRRQGRVPPCISSAPGPANLLHWVLDVTFSEDADRNAMANLSMARKVALSLIKASPAKGSTPVKRLQAA